MKTTLILFLLGAAAVTPAKTFFSHEQALKHTFGAKVETAKTTHYWTKEQRLRLAEIVDVKKAKDVRSYHKKYQTKANNGPRKGDTVWFDKRIVRTKAQEIMLVIDSKGVVKELLVCAFDEPLKYKASAKWYAQFEGLKLNDNLQLKKGIHGVSGATLTARSTTAAVRELLGAAQLAREVAAAQKKKQKTPHK